MSEHGDLTWGDVQKCLGSREVVGLTRPKGWRVSTGPGHSLVATLKEGLTVIPDGLCGQGGRQA